MEQLNSETNLPGLAEDLDNLEKFNLSYKKRLTRFIIRESITIGLVYWFWDKPWMKYFLFVWVPLVLFNLFLYIRWDKIVAIRKRRIEEKYQG